MKEIRIALKITLQILGFFCVLVLATSFFLDYNSLPRLPWLSTPHHCYLCGMSHSFLALSKGDLGEAVQFNSLGPTFYTLFILLAISGFIFTILDLTRFFDRLKAN